VAEQDQSFQDARILIVDDEEMNVRMLEQVLEPAGYTQLASTTDAREVLPLFREFRPDLVLLDIKMPHLDGHQVLDQLRQELPREEYLPVLVLTSDGGAHTRRRALSGGANDFLTKPFSPVEARLRIHNLLHTRFLHRSLSEHNRLLEERVRERTVELTARTTELDEARLEILERLARAAEYRDDETGLHTQRVSRIAALLAECLGVGPDEVELIRRASPLHDIGKIGIPDRVLLKDGPLDLAETKLMQSHTIIGAKILSGSRVPLLHVGKHIALTHHEWWDGTGYPSGLSSEAIPLAGRLVAVADVFDALTHHRPYKEAWPSHHAVREIERYTGTQFDPAVVAGFLELAHGGQLEEAAFALPDTAQEAAR
jgi:putative two-component system response regulator